MTVNARRQCDRDDSFGVRLRDLGNHRRPRKSSRSGSRQRLADHADELIVIGGVHMRGHIVRRASRLRIAQRQRRDRRVDVRLDDEGLEKDRE